MMFRRRAVVDEGVAGRAVDREVESHSAFDASSILALLAGLFYAVFGLLVLLDTGLSGFPDEPMNEVFGFTQSPLLGAINIGVGLLLIISAAVWGRGLMMFTSAAMVVGGIVLVAARDDLPASLMTETSYGWLGLGIGAVLLLAALLLPSVAAHRRVVDTRA